MRVFSKYNTHTRDGALSLRNDIPKLFLLKIIKIIFFAERYSKIIFIKNNKIIFFAERHIGRSRASVNLHEIVNLLGRPHRVAPTAQTQFLLMGEEVYILF